MSGLARLVVARPRAVLALVLLVSGFLATGLRFTSTRPIFEGELPASDRIVAETALFDERHPDRADHVLGLVADDGLWNARALGKLMALSEAAGELEGALADVQSLATWRQLVSDAQGVRSERLLPEVPDGPGAVAALRARVESDPLIAGRLISRDGAMALIRVPFARDTPPETIHAGIENLRERYGGRDEIAVFGPDYVNVAIDRTIDVHTGVLLPLAGVLILLFLYLCFGRLQAVWTTATVIALSVVDFLGLMGLLGIPQSVLSSSIPVLLIVILGSYVVHLLQRVYLEAEQRPWLEAVSAAVASTGRPIVVATATSAIGLASLAVFRVFSVREFGILAAGSILIGGTLSVTWLPALLAATSRTLPPERLAGRRTFRAVVGRVLEGLVAISEHPARVRWGAVAFVLLAVLATARLEVGSSPAGFFPDSHPVGRGFERLQEHFGANGYLFVEFESREPQGAYSPSFLRGVDRFQRAAGQLDGVQHASSAVDRVFMRLHRRLNGDRAEAEVIPDSAAAVAQYAEIFRWGDPEAFGAMIERVDQPRRIVVDVFADVGDSARIEELVASLRSIAETSTGGDSFIFGGEFVRWVAQNRYIVAGKILNVVVSILLVGLVCFGVLRRARLAIVSVVPAAVAALAVLGAMALIGIRLDLASCVTTAIVVGIGVDFAVHLLLRRQELEGCAAGGELRRATLRRAAPPILYDASSNVVAFSVCILSPFVPVSHFGWLICLSMLTAAAATLILLPVLMDAPPAAGRRAS